MACLPECTHLLPCQMRSLMLAPACTRGTRHLAWLQRRKSCPLVFNGDQASSWGYDNGDGHSSATPWAIFLIYCLFYESTEVTSHETTGDFLLFPFSTASSVVWYGSHFLKTQAHLKMQSHLSLITAIIHFSALPRGRRTPPCHWLMKQYISPPFLSVPFVISIILSFLFISIIHPFFLQRFSQS